MTFDPRWLVAPVDRRAVRAHAAELRRRGAGNPRRTRYVVVSALLGFLGFWTASSVAFGIGTRIGPAALLIWVAAVGAVVWACIATPRALLARSDESIYRLAHFAAANGMAYEPHEVDPGLPGLIFGLGSGRAASERVRGTSPRFVEFANYRYTTSSGKNSQTHRWGYVAIRLDTPLPNIVLDATGNNGVFGSNLPASFDKSQRLSLEGDFDAYFTLYCPAGYEVDALYLFTPDIMARFIDTAAMLDVEIVDSWLFLYARRSFSTLDPAMWAWLFGVVGAVTEKLQRWERWRDERLALPADRPRALPDAGHPLPFPAGAPAPGTIPPAPPPGAPFAATAPAPAPAAALAPPVPPAPGDRIPRRPRGVAPPGQRLRRRFPWWAIAVLLVTLGSICVLFVSGMLAAMAN